MNKKNIIIITSFITLVIVQLFFSSYMIIYREIVLIFGTPYKVQVSPVDPYDAFRGYYVAIDTENLVPKKIDGNITENDFFYLSIEKDNNGYVNAILASTEKPSNKNYIKLKSNSYNSAYNEIILPYDRYYLSEYLAERVEEEMWPSDGRQPAYITIKVLNGYDVIESLYINDVSVYKYFK